jgi:hypothetical protein
MNRNLKHGMKLMPVLVCSLIEACMLLLAFDFFGINLISYSYIEETPC